jgi:hypothetical protein
MSAMHMSRRAKVELKELTLLEAELEETLIPCLKQCANGRWGLFGAYDRFVEMGYVLAWPEARRLNELAISIRAIRAQYGEHNELVEGFLKLRTMHKPNDPGEPKLAQAFLDRIESEKREKGAETGSTG